MNKNANNRYDIILNLMELNKQLLQCTTYEEVNNYRYKLLSFIEDTSILKNIYQDIIAKEDVLKKESEFNACINKIHSFIIALLNAHTKYKTFTLLRQKVSKMNTLEEVSLIENKEIIGSFIECPSLIYYPSLTLLLPPKNYLNLKIRNQPITNLSDLYSLFDDSDKVLEKLLLLMSVKYNFEFFLLNKDFFNIGIQENNFNAAFLYCVVYCVNKSLQTILQPKKDFDINIKASNHKYNDNSSLKTNNCPLTKEEIQILSLRKTLPSNKYKDIGQKLNPKLTEGNVSQKFLSIKNKLGANSPDEAVAIFERNYYLLGDN